MGFICVHRCTCSGVHAVPSWRRFQLKSTSRVPSSLPLSLSLSSFRSILVVVGLLSRFCRIDHSVSFYPNCAKSDRFFLVAFFSVFFVASTSRLSGWFFLFLLFLEIPLSPDLSPFSFLSFFFVPFYSVGGTVAHEKFTGSMKSSPRVKLMERGSRW